MIVSFAVENFGSIRDKQELIFSATSDKVLEKTNVYSKSITPLLKCVAIYGANASGKSSVLNAMLCMKTILMTSVSKNLEDLEMPRNPFMLSTETKDAPTEFEIEFLIENVKYRYGFSYSDQAIVEEWLYRKNPKAREAKLFTREAQNIKPSPTLFREAKDMVKKTRENVLFIRTCAEWNIEVAEQIIEWFRKFRNVSGVTEKGYYKFTAERLQSDTHKDSILKLAQKADFNLTAIQSTPEKRDLDDLPKVIPNDIKKDLLKKNPHKAEIQTSHTIFNPDGSIGGEVIFDLQNHESQGTCKFVALSGPLEHTMEEGSVLIIDEFEARLHPNLTKAILKWFMGPHNTKGAQLIIATHDTGLMVPEILRRDQIWFCEKDKQGASSLYCLDEFDSTKVRSNTRFDKQYLQGIFGATPNVALNEI